MIALAMIAAAALAQAPIGPAPGHIVQYSSDAELNAMQERFGWSDSVTVDGTVYVSGVIAYVLAEDKGLEPAYTRAFDELTAVLKKAGVSWADVVEVRSFHTDPKAQFEAIAAVKRRYRAAPDPAWTAVGTSGLLDPRGKTEIALVARKPVAK